MKAQITLRKKFLRRCQKISDAGGGGLNEAYCDLRLGHYSHEPYGLTFIALYCPK